MPHGEIFFARASCYYSPYIEIRLSLEALDLINASCLNKTPAKIFRDLLASEIPDVDRITQHQIYFQWHLVYSRTWRLDTYQLLSTSKLLANLETLNWHEILTSGSLHAHAIYIRGTIPALISRTHELVTDATNKTNNSQ